MSSDEEDFNDIYGDDEPATTTTTTTTSAPETKPEEETSKLADGGTSSSATDNNNTSNNPVSSLDQLAALQALSSNLTQINNNATATTEDNKADTDSSKNNANVNSDSTTTAAPAAQPLPWEQLQQTMSQFNPQQGNQPQQQLNDNEIDQRHVKADISKDNCKMFIGGLNWETTEEGLRNYFNKYGHVTDLKIMKDPNTGRSRGFGFLTFELPSSVDEVVKTQHILDGKVIDPKRSIPREEQDKTGKIFVGGIGADVRPKEFEEFFAQYGSIIDAQLMLDKDTGRSRGFGFVTYDSPEAVDRVCQNKYIEFKGKQIEIKRAEPRHLQKGQYGGANPNNRNVTGYGPQSTSMMGSSSNNIPLNSGSNNAASANPAAAMFQNPMMGGFNPMMGGFNPQAMQDYYTKMQEYYQQMQQQTGMDYSQMYQQQMQQMAMMMPGFSMPGGAQPSVGNGSQSPQNDGSSGENGSNSNDVQTIGDNDNQNQNNNDDDNRDRRSSREHRGSNTPEVNIPRGPRDPSSGPSHNGGGYQHRDRGDRSDRRSRRGRNGGGYRGDRNGGYRGGRSGYNKRNDNGYHPYNR